MSKYIDAYKLKSEIDNLESFSCISEEQDGFYSAISRINDIIDSLQQEQPKVDLSKSVEFECIGKKVNMTIKELINYYIDRECCDVADECGF